MITHVRTVCFQGIEATAVDVQVHMAPGKFGFSIVGLGDKAVTESKERVRAALTASGLSLPVRRITVNLAPADLPKEGSHFDLPIALSLMAAMGAIPADALEDFMALGELALDGTIAPVAGVLPAAIAANGEGLGLICPKDCGSEAAWADPEMPVLAPMSLIALVNHFRGTQVLTRPEPRIADRRSETTDMADIRGQEFAKRAMEIAAAGGHNMLMIGPPGSGKSMLAARLATILPPLGARELLEISMIASVAGTLSDGKLSDRRPFRAPHHSASMAALVGGGLRARPGEISLAHHGVLFLDELPEFHPQVLDSLRQPLETGDVVIARANARVTYPARFQLIAAMNPCRCGMAGTPGFTCRRGTRCAANYQERLSGPLLDRFDLTVEVAAVSANDLLVRQRKSETSSVVGQRVAMARETQAARFQQLGRIDLLTNSAMPASLIEELAMPDPAGLQLLSEAAEVLKLSARGYHRVLKVARTIADLDQMDEVGRIHIAEALGYRGRREQMSAAA